MYSNIPTPEAIQALVQSKEPGKVVMLNLLKFKPVSGVASYAEYAQHVMPIIDRIGAKIIFVGPVTSTVVGDQSWDSILLVGVTSRNGIQSTFRLAVAITRVFAPSYFGHKSQRKRA
jgi:hypothetical protein